MSAPMSAPDFIKRSAAHAVEQDRALSDSVARMLAELETGGEAVAQRMARDLDRFEGDIVVSDEAIAAACKRVRNSAASRADGNKPATVRQRPPSSKTPLPGLSSA